MLVMLQIPSVFFKQCGLFMTISAQKSNGHSGFLKASIVKQPSRVWSPRVTPPNCQVYKLLLAKNSMSLLSRWTHSNDWRVQPLRLVQPLKTTCFRSLIVTDYAFNLWALHNCKQTYYRAKFCLTDSLIQKNRGSFRLSRCYYSHFHSTTSCNT